MRVKSSVKAGGVDGQHNQTVNGVRVKSKVKAGGMDTQHNQSVKGLRVKSGVKAGEDPGRILMNHNQTLAGAR